MSTQEAIYREILEIFGKRMLTLADVQKYTGLGDYRTIRKYFPFGDGNIISARVVARVMAGDDDAF